MAKGESEAAALDASRARQGGSAAPPTTTPGRAFVADDMSEQAA